MAFDFRTHPRLGGANLRKLNTVKLRGGLLSKEQKDERSVATIDAMKNKSWQNNNLLKRK